MKGDIKMIKYNDNKKHAYFNGLKFTRDNKTGYYLNSTIGERLHRYVWSYHNGTIPKGKHIHHINGNKNVNDISNLDLIKHEEHLREHGKVRANDNEEWLNVFQTKGVLSAKEWHTSKEGIEWHKEHFENVKDKFLEHKSFKCKQCDVTFTSQNNGKNKFCSNRCKSAFRRDSGVDDEVRICEQCGKEYIINKYRKNRTCSKSCSNMFFKRK